MSGTAMFLAGVVLGATCVVAVMMCAHAWRIVRDYRQRRRSRTFDVPEYTTLLDVIMREIDIYREKRALKRAFKEGATS